MHKKFQREHQNNFAEMRKAYNIQMNLNHESNDQNDIAPSRRYSLIQQINNVKEGTSKSNIILIKIVEFLKRGKYQFIVYVSDMSSIMSAGLKRT